MTPRAAALLVALAALAPLALAKSAPIPSLSPGDYWETKFETSTGQGQLSATTRTEIVGTEAITVEGITYSALKSTSKSTSTTSVGQGGVTFDLSTTTDASSWTRASDGATIKIVSSTTTTSPFGGGPTTTQSETVYSPPCAFYQYPLEVGKKWSVECTSKTTTGGHTSESKATYNYRVLREESVTVAAGTFDTIVVANGTDESALTYWAPKACGPVRTSVKSASGSFNVDLQSYKCADEGSFSEGASTPTPSPTTTPTPPPSASTPPPTTSPSPSTPPADTSGDDEKKTPAPGAAIAVLALVIAGVGIAARRR